ncbi:MAG TPA: formimidoylglutamase [Bacteroidia bacterium]|nr:formimidoylglutamase [Bacteroidia bacterium]
MEIEQYLKPGTVNSEYAPFMWGSHIRKNVTKNFPDLDGVHIAIIGVGEARNSNGNDGCAAAPDKVRENLYKLSYIQNVVVADLGNIVPGNTPKDTYVALEFVCAELLDRKIIPVIIGGSQDLTYSMYTAYQRLQQTVNIVCADSKIDLGEIHSELDSETYISKILQYQPSLLFNYSHIGYQTHFVNPEEVETIKKMFFDTYRLGQIQTNLEEAEPIVRNADILSFDISAIRKSDAPGTLHATPNGLYGEEACQIFRYAGMSDKLSSIGIFEVNPLFDDREQTSALAAQMIWYFMDGFANRKSDFPGTEKKDYLKYRVTMKSGDHEIVFYKSTKTDRWWMEVPYRVGAKSKYERHHMVPCSYEDYELACTEEMPDRWWQAYQKLS